MKNAGMAGAVALVGIGLLSIGLSNFATRATASPSVAIPVNLGPAEPTIVWYHVVDGDDGQVQWIYRAWSDALIEGRVLQTNGPGSINWGGCGLTNPCVGEWIVISSPNEGLNAAADINHDEIVNAADIGLLVAAWGDAPRNPMPPSDCPLGLIQ